MTLLVLAAGMGSRYGGLKQIEPMGPAGEVILDYSIYDAMQAGFKRVVFVIRRDFEEEFKERVGSRYEDRVEIGYVFQELNSLPSGFRVPPGRTKPWGTGHAIWCAGGSIDGPFVAINADDFYGSSAYAKVAEFFAGHPKPTQFCMAGYKLADTLSHHGPVSRGVCRVTESGILDSVVELTGIQADGEEIISLPPDGSRRVLTGEEPVSLNFWGFSPKVFDWLDEGLGVYLNAYLDNPDAEYYIPAAVSGMINCALASVEVLPVEGPWFGVTYPEDREHVVEALTVLTECGMYPEGLGLGKG